MGVRWRDKLDMGKSQPFLDAGENISDCEGILEEAGWVVTRIKPRMTTQGKAMPSCPLQAAIPSCEGFLMLSRPEIVGVDEEVNVRRNHREWPF